MEAEDRREGVLGGGDPRPWDRVGGGGGGLWQESLVCGETTEKEEADDHGRVQPMPRVGHSSLGNLVQSLCTGAGASSPEVMAPLP